MDSRRIFSLESGRNILLLLLLPALLVVAPFALAVQQLNWKDLGVSAHPTEDPFFGLGFEDKRNLETVLKSVSQRAQGVEISSDLAGLEVSARTSLELNGHNVERLIEKEYDFRNKIRNQARMVREDLNGREIRIPGYVLPLAFNGVLTTEFLLVPYTGACIHTPPPPPSQIIHVFVEDGFEIDGLFTPVWVSGELKTGVIRQSVALSDGMSSFDVGYHMSAATVEAYD